MRLFSRVFLSRPRPAHANGQSAVTPSLRPTHPSDMAESLRTLPQQALLHRLTAMPPAERADVFAYLDRSLQAALLPRLPRAMARDIFAHLAADERTDLYKTLPPEERRALLPALSQQERDDMLRLSAYEEGTIGSLTTSDYVAVAPDMRVDEALAHVRATAPDRETIYVLYVLDAHARLCGTLSLRDLLLADDHLLVRQIMRPRPVVARALWPGREAADLIRRYDLLALPVLNGDERMIGIVTVDDVLDMTKEEDASRLARFGGTTGDTGSDLDILATPLHRMFSVRVFWLVLLTLFGIITSTFVATQEELLSHALVLAAFIAPIVDMGGNVGSQSATLIIRAMALGDLSPCWRDVLRVIWRELPVAAALGLVVALLEAVLARFSKGVGLDILLVVGLSMLCCTLLGGLIGALLPFLARRVHADPATLSSPLITSIMDLVGVLTYFALASTLLGQLME